MRSFGRRRVLALAAGLLAAAVGCSAASPSTPSQVAATTSAPVTPSPSATTPLITPVEAAKVFTTFTATDDLLRAGGDLRLAMELTRDAEAQLTSADFLSTGNRPSRYTWGTPTLFVPRFRHDEGAPWFTVLTTRNGHPTLLTFARADDWRLSSATQLLPGQDPPHIQLDAEGYATALAPDDKSVTISPQFMGPLHATVAEAGETGVAAGLLERGPYTTDVAEQITTDRERAKIGGFSYDSIFSAGDYPVYALRMVDGGALIQYAMTRTTTTTVETDKADFVPVPEAARWLYHNDKARRFLKTTEINQYATVVPRSGTPTPAAIIAHIGSLTKAVGGDP
ncbi:hypothetical protein [Nonomuraea guangzhouensis]|uniref:DUF8094 domain-containing protein n=1 Tax=Nonomuraea guangzhouensis TaxID=1291555 RepID=A0ABW4GH07_9ACTN|nr:hypothetical protein [Nonomuraea guangzhouensis]